MTTIAAILGALSAIFGGALVWALRAMGKARADVEQKERDLDAAKRSKDKLKEVQDESDSSLIDRLTR
jgi:hypothetical protein